jgi:subfamily B ATP-binding cassette protein MsbA
MARQVWNARGLFVLTLLLTGLSAALEGFGIGLLVPFLDGLLNPGGEPFRIGIEFIDVHLLAVEASQLERLYRVAGLLLGVVWLRGLIGFMAHRYSVLMRENILDRIRREIIDQVQAVSLHYFSQKRSGEIINTLTSEVKRLQTLFNIAKEMLVRGTVFLAYGAAILWLSWQLSLIAFVFCVIVLVMMNHLLKNLRANGRLISKGNAEVTNYASELLNGIRTIMEFGTQKHEAREFAHHSRVLRDANVSTVTKSGLVHPLTMGISFTALIGIIIVAVKYYILPGLLSAAAFLTFMFVLLRIIPILQSINTQRAQWSVYRGALEDVAEILDTSDKPYLPNGTRELEEFTNAIEVNNVTFGYEPGQKVIKNVSFEIPRGETVAIVGSSGSGKSTLVNLIARLYDPTEGQILIDGKDLRTVNQESLRARMAIVNQSTFLFNTDVWENIAYGLDPEIISKKDIRQAAEEANALDFIEELPKGFDTILGERGARLSGGQRQRIAIARALLRDPEILILDEATSALDSASEKLVQDSLDRLMENRTVIVIAHRLSTIESADKVLVLEDGKIVESGSYEALLEQKGQLWQYHSLQFQMA